MRWDFPLYTQFLWGIQAFGLVAALLVRLMEGSTHQRMYQGVFLIALSLVGLSAITQRWLQTASCTISGTTLAVMVLATTCDWTQRRPRGDEGESLGESVS